MTYRTKSPPRSYPWFGTLHAYNVYGRALVTTSNTTVAPRILKPGPESGSGANLKTR